MTSNQLLLGVGGVVALCVLGQTLWTHASIQQIRGELALARDDSKAHLSRIPAEVAKLMSGSSSSVDLTGITQDVSFRTDGHAAQRIGELPASPNAESLAKVISELDGWLVTPGDEAKIDARKAVLLAQLRNLVRAEAGQHLERALKSTNGAEGAKALAEARRVLALYPMSNDRSVIDEVTELSARQAEVATRLEALRRQRYNRWALEQVEQALKHFNDNVSRWNPLNDNKALLPPLVALLGPIDPLLLEPVVLQLYEYVIERMKSKLSESSRLDLAKRLVDPNIARKSVGEF